jgi:hypothetical protein
VPCATTRISLSPLAERLFSLPEVTGVFLGADFITVTKDGAGDWYQLKPAIRAVIMEHFTAGRPVLLAAVESAVAEASHDTRLTGRIMLRGTDSSNPSPSSRQSVSLPLLREVLGKTEDQGPFIYQCQGSTSA